MTTTSDTTLEQSPTQQTIILIADPRILAIEVRENNDPMVDLREQSQIKIGPSPEIPNNNDYFKMRKTVFDKLLEAQNRLEKGIYFCLYEGYRSIALQTQLYNNRYKIIQSHHPDWTADQLFDETTKMVSPVINKDGTKNVPPHSTGAAVDVYLINEKGEALDMGIHPADWMDDENDLFSYTASTHISKEAQSNRAKMSKVLSAVGFVNYPTEYWHWSYGDRYWAYHTHQPYALYGSISQ